MTRYVARADVSEITLRVSHQDEEVDVLRNMEVSYNWSQAIAYVGDRKDIQFHILSSRDKNDDLIVIDDIKLAMCSPPVPSPEGCTEDQFSCGTGTLRNDSSMYEYPYFL